MTVNVLLMLVAPWQDGGLAISSDQLDQPFHRRGEELLAAVIMSSALGVAVFLIFGWIQNLAIGKWHGERA